MKYKNEHDEEFFAKSNSNSWKRILKRVEEYESQFLGRLEEVKVPLLIICIGLINTIILSKPYWFSSVPVGWDTPTYIYLNKLVLKGGVSALISETYYTHFYSVFSSLLVRLGLFDPFSIEIMLPLFLSFFVVILTSVMAARFFHNSKISVLSAFFALGWFNVYSMVSSIHRNLLAFVLLLLVFAYLPECFEKRSFFSILVVLIPSFLITLVHWETFFLSFLIVLVFAFFLKLLIKQYSVKNLFINVLLYALPLILTAILLSSVLSAYVTHYVTHLPLGNSVLPLLELPLYFGGFLIPLVIIGFANCIQRLKTKDPYRTESALLVSWGATIILCSLTPLFGIPFPQWRILIFFPLPLFAAIGLYVTVKRIRDTKIGRVLASKKFIPYTLAILLLISNSFAATIYTDVWMRSYIDENTYLDLRRLEKDYSFSQKPIVLLYFYEAAYTEGVLALYRNWIKATIGDHYIFFGKLHYLLGGYIMPFQDAYMNDVSLATWTELESISSHWYDHPVLVIEGDFYPSLSPNEKGLLDEIAPGAFVLREDFQSLPDLHDIHLAAYRDSYSSSRNWYAARKNWSIEENVAEHIEDSPKSQFKMTFSLPINEAGNYTINIRMQDNEVSSAPVKVFIDNVITSTIYYSGTMQPKVFTLQVNNLTRNFHYVSLSIERTK